MFGIKHLEALLFVVLFVYLVMKFIKYKGYETKNVMLFATISFYVFEVLKIIFTVVSTGTYGKTSWPFYLCSTPLYIMWILHYSTNEALLNKVKPVVFTIFLTGGVAALAYPSLILGGTPNWSFTVDNIRPAISILFHAIMILVPVYMINSGYYKPRYKDVYTVEIALLIMIMVVSIINFIFNADFFFLNWGEGSPIRFLHDQNLFLFRFLTIFLHILIIGLVHISSTLVFNIMSKRNT